MDLKVRSALSINSYVILGKSLNYFGVSVASTKTKTKTSVSRGCREDQRDDVGTFLSMRLAPHERSVNGSYY